MHINTLNEYAYTLAQAVHKYSSACMFHSNQISVQKIMRTVHVVCRNFFKFKSTLRHQTWAYLSLLPEFREGLLQTPFAHVVSLGLGLLAIVLTPTLGLLLPSSLCLSSRCLAEVNHKVHDVQLKWLATAADEDNCAAWHGSGIA